MQNNYVHGFQSSFCTRTVHAVDLLIIDNIRGFDLDDYSKDIFLFPFLSLRIEISKF